MIKEAKDSVPARSRVALRLERKAVRRYISAEVAVDLLGGQGRRAIALDPYLRYLAKRWQNGQHVAAYLFDEVKKKGYRGSKPTVRRQLAGWRTAEPPPPVHVMLPGPRTLASCSDEHQIGMTRTTYS